MDGVQHWAEGPLVDGACPNENCAEYMVAVRYPATMEYINHMHVVYSYFDLPMRCSTCGSLYPPANESQLETAVDDEMNNQEMIRLVREGRVKIVSLDEEETGLVVKMKVEKEKPAFVRMREQSGSVDSDDALVVFLYTLARDEVTTGVIDDLIDNHSISHKAFFSNGWLAQWAKDAANRLTKQDGAVTHPIIPGETEVRKHSG